MTAGRDGRGGEEKLRSEVREAGDALLRSIGNNCQFEGQHSVSLQLLLFFPHQNSKKILCPFENLTQIKCLFSVPACSGCATNKFFFFSFLQRQGRVTECCDLDGVNWGPVRPPPKIWAEQSKWMQGGKKRATLHPAPAAAPRSPADGQSSGVGGRRLVVI